MSGATARPASAPRRGGERERRRHHAVGADPDEARRVAPDRRGPHGAPERRPAVEEGERDDGDGGEHPDPDRLALDGRPEALERGARGERLEGAFVGSEEVQRHLAQQHRAADRDHDDAQRVAALDRPHGEQLEDGADRGGGGDRRHRRDRQRQPELGEEGAEHAAEHEELALGEVDRPGGREDDREAERHERVDGAALEARYEELKEFVHTP